MAEKGAETPQGTYLGERVNDAGLIVEVFDKDGQEVEVALPDDEQERRRTPPEVPGA